jgi:glyoxylase-like metal-dependent hydrolase (beta-lactamase superfamily II)
MTLQQRIRAGAAALALSLTLGLAAGTVAEAAAPFVKGQAPGYYRMMVGDFEVTALSDGTVMLPMTTFLTGTAAGETKRAYERAFLTDPVETSVNTYLVNTGTKLVLIDTGAGKLFGPTLGVLLANLKAAGYQPEQIDEVYITHMHADHVGGLTVDGKPAFPNAVVRADKHDADFWLDPKTLAGAPKDDRASVEGVQAAFAPYIAAGRFKPFEGDAELVPGVSAHASHGHTPGHTTYVVESKGQKLVLWGDLMHVAAVQFPNPAVTIKFDSDSKTAAVERRKAYIDAAKQGYWVAAAHLPFPGVGHLRKDGSGYVFVPANYSIPR